MLNADGMVLFCMACWLRSIEILALVTKGYRTNGRIYVVNYVLVCLCINVSLISNY